MTAQKIINIAKAEIGVKESPKNSNNVKYNTEYYGKAVSGSGYPWCCAFVWWVFKKAGASKLFCSGKKTALCEYVKTSMKSQIVAEPKAGDLVLFQFDKDKAADHIGIVESVKADGSVVTIEGNTAVGNDSNGGEVMRRTRKRNVIMCFVRPAYGEEVKEEQKNVSYYPRYTGQTKSIVMALQKIGVESSFTYRKKIAIANGITGYKGTAKQNTTLLILLKQGKLVRA